MFGSYNFNVPIITLNIGHKESIVGLTIAKVFISIEYFFFERSDWFWVTFCSNDVVSWMIGLLEWKSKYPPTPLAYRQFSFPGKTTWDKKNPTRKLSAYGISMLTVTKLWMKCQLTADDLRDFCSSYISQPNKTRYNWITKQEKTNRNVGCKSL